MVDLAGEAVASENRPHFTQMRLVGFRRRLFSGSRDRTLPYPRQAGKSALRLASE